MGKSVVPSEGQGGYKRKISLSHWCGCYLQPAFVWDTGVILVVLTSCASSIEWLIQTAENSVLSSTNTLCFVLIAFNQ